MVRKQKSTGQSRVEIYADEYIPVMNICPMQLSVTTEPFGQGRPYNFTKFGDIRNIAYQDLVRIIDNHQRFLEGGFFYILDQRVVQKHGLVEIYKKLLTKEKLDKIFEMSEGALELYELANQQQKEFINRVLIAKIRDGEDVDLNMISKIEKISGEKIIEKAKAAQEIMNPEE